MKNAPNKFSSLTAKQVLQGYSMGIFPMGDDENTISWFEANPRAILPIELNTNELNISRSLKQVLKKNTFEIKINTCFNKVIRECAKRENTWINKLIIKTYNDLHSLGYAHSVEAWQGGKLAGGLYGVAYRGSFFGESMFHKTSNASKAAVVKLYEILKKNKFILFDIQMMTPHFEALGAIEISKRGYVEILDRAMNAEKKFVY